MLGWDQHAKALAFTYSTGRPTKMRRRNSRFSFQAIFGFATSSNIGTVMQHLLLDPIQQNTCVDLHSRFLCKELDSFRRLQGTHSRLQSNYILSSFLYKWATYYCWYFAKNEGPVNNKVLLALFNWTEAHSVIRRSACLEAETSGFKIDAFKWILEWPLVHFELAVQMVCS